VNVELFVDCLQGLDSDKNTREADRSAYRSIAATRERAFVTAKNRRYRPGADGRSLLERMFSGSLGTFFTWAREENIHAVVRG